MKNIFRQVCVSLVSFILLQMFIPFCLLNKIQFFGSFQKKIICWRFVWIVVVTPPCSLPFCVSEPYPPWLYFSIQETLSLVISEVQLDCGLFDTLKLVQISWKKIKVLQSCCPSEMQIASNFLLEEFGNIITCLVRLTLCPMWPLNFFWDFAIGGFQLSLQLLYFFRTSWKIWINLNSIKKVEIAAVYSASGGKSKQLKIRMAESVQNWNWSGWIGVGRNDM